MIQRIRINGQTAQSCQVQCTNHTANAASTAGSETATTGQAEQGGQAQKTGCACGLSPNGCTGAHRMLQNNVVLQNQILDQ